MAIGDFAGQDFDYVVAGGGAAGCVLASRLSERSSIKVLLVETGEDFQPGQEPMELKDVLAGTAHGNPRFTWGQTVAFPPKPSNAPDQRKRVRYAQGRVMGGGSSVNGMISLRGVPTDYDGWEAAGAKGWGWEDVLPYFQKMETDADYPGGIHGADGPMIVRRTFEDRWPGFTKGFLEAIKEDGWPDIKDNNANFGDGYFPIAIANTEGRRISTATAYLTKEARARPNLHILSGARAQKLLLDGTRVTGVRVEQNGQAVDINAGEVIASCGALHTPALLMRSGIGPGAELAERGIEVVLDKPGVGKHLMEHPGVNLGCYMKRPARLPAGLRYPMYAGLRWSSSVEGCPAGDMYMIPMNKSFWHSVGERLGLIMLWVNKSYSTGEVRLNASDPLAEPDVDFNMCSDERDLERLAIGTRMMIRLQAHPTFQDTIHDVFPISYSDLARKVAVYSQFNRFQTWLGGQVMDASGPIRRLLINRMMADEHGIDDLMKDDDVLHSWIKRAVLGHFHASCSCRMGAPDDPGAVTDPSARVYGMEGLRICDASIMPAVPCANTNFPTIMVGEKVAAIILAEQ
ncbi:MAG: GMC family oxidoreductase N-terminal domain-containing protein [Rhodospirillales bacterium]|jgi:5-(hydroxymethyl)furfural/furfural oxidase|nr:GMC family oxidoreductase N-terminal domain-containing protein [Rhodospirillales bacterium]